MRPADAQRLLDALMGVEAPVGFAVFDRSHTCLAANAALARRHGRETVDLLGRRPADALPPALASHVVAMIDRVVSTGETIHADDLPHERAGAGVYLRSSWYPISENGEITSVAMFVVDDTTTRQTSAALRDSRARTARLLQASDELSRAVTIAEVVTAIDALGRRSVGADRSVVVLHGVQGLTLAPGLDNITPVIESLPRWSEDVATPTAHVAHNGWPLFLPSRDDLVRQFPEPRVSDYLARSDEHAWAVLPLNGSTGRLGALRFAFTTEQEFDDEMRRFLRAVAQQCALAIERARLFEHERTAAVSLTRGLMPPRLPGIAGLELGARSVPGSPSDVVGGDWYDAFVLPDGAVSLVVGDVMGHGLDAAAGMGQMRAALRALALSDPEPASVLTGLDRLVEKGGTVEMATVVYAVLNPEDGVVRFGDAGHLPLLHVPGSGPVQLVKAETGTTPLGVPERRLGRTIQLQPGDVVLGFTDGLVENRSRALGDGLAQLQECLTQVRHQRLEAMLDHIVAVMHDPDSTDDLTVLGLRWNRTHNIR